MKKVLANSAFSLFIVVSLSACNLQDILSSVKGQSSLNEQSSSSVLKNAPIPASQSRVYRNSTDEFFISSEGMIYNRRLSTGAITVVSAQGPFWSRSSNGYGYDLRAWSLDSWLYADANSNLYAIDYQSLNGSYNIGMGARFTYKEGRWNSDDDFNQTFFPSLPYDVGNEIPGALLAGHSWLVIDQSNSLLYRVVFNDQTLEVYSYNLESPNSNGPLVLSTSLNYSVLRGTFLGVNNTIQNSILSDGKSIFRLVSTGGSLSIDVITVPGSIVVENSIRLPGGYVNTYDGGVTNWNYINNILYYLDPSMNLVYQWDLNSLHSPTLLTGSAPVGLDFVYY